ncbi:hypothetical protein N825_33875 [Skermanella stibiiresistens SB22]|uniref:SET domain-containing protein n=1 Tax=Skermanella stibiiresistens SB22 TaxID=1385369 RepID=W9HAN7_9PROT|nr:hypothetical protein N825_33875 [Skermanella stibiiresistens SB22]
MFAMEPIPAGTPIWAFDDRIDRILVPDASMLRTYPTFARMTESHGCVIAGLGLLMLGDDARFINHSDTPNVDLIAEGDWRAFKAARDIAAGEEITCDYEDICDDVRTAGSDRYLETAFA